MDSEFPFFNLRLLEAFDLTDEQRTQLDEIRKELETELEQFIDKHFELMLQEFVTDGESDDSPEDIVKKAEEAEEAGKLFRKQFNDMQAELKVKSLAVLTNEQIERYTRLINDPPEHVKKMLGKTEADTDKEEKSVEQIAEPKKPDVWQPGANSWKPGDPLPEGVTLPSREVQHTRQRGLFPRGEQTDESRERNEVERPDK
jgi:hypothetical protein